MITHFEKSGQQDSGQAISPGHCVTTLIDLLSYLLQPSSLERLLTQKCLSTYKSLCITCLPYELKSLSTESLIYVYYAYFMRISCVFHAYFMRISCVYYAYFMRISCVFHAYIMRILCVYYAYIMSTMCNMRH